MLGKLAGGARTLLDWLGSGGQTVEQPLAEARASVCAGRPCPHNGKGGLEAYFTVPASEAIRRQLELKHAMKIETHLDDKLGVCNLCLCPLKLKVHVPLKEIRPHLSADVREKMPDFCWMKNEQA